MGAFEPAGPGVDFVALEREIIEWWRERDTVARYLRRNDGSERRFSFIDGPITANNPMGVHHAWGRMYKDLFQRYQTMLGCRQRYQNGFDGQGLWIEVEVEKELGFTSKRDIEAFGVGRFVELCKERVRRFSAIQTEQSKRLGYWMDWDNSYHTMSDENNYTIWMFLKRCAERGWLYEGRDVMPWCPRCGTGLSEHEIVTEGYREIVHPGLFVRLPVLGREGPEPESLLIWTTTPWTLPANVAAAVGPEIAYVRVRVPAPKGGSEVLIVARERLAESVPGPREVLGELPGSALADLTYRGPFDDLPAQAGVEHRVVAWDEVSAEEGTGIVHIAPGAGREDFRLGRDLGLAEIAPLDEFGDFGDGFGALSGMNVYDVPETVYEGLRAGGALYRLEDYSHRYPVCWRCQSELVFRLVDEWFISMDELRHRIADVTRRITWVPEFGLRRELDWLAAMDDWMVSKKRYWGLALPIYRCECGEFEVIGSEDELRERAVEGWDEFEGHSPHRPWIDAVKIACKSCGQAVPRISDVGNPWLDAGIVPFSTLGYRSDREYWAEWFPADWISESFPGQFRNWFYSLLTMSTVLEDAEPFRTVFSYALMRDESGEEMHKSRGNAIWFEDAADRMGVDTMRWLYARQNPAANLNFGYGAADEARRRVLIPLWNVYSFFLTYAIIDGYDPAGPAAPPPERRSELDRWVLSELAELIEGVRSALDGYRPDDAARRIEAFVDRLSNWYVRRSRRRFWRAGALGEGAGDADKLGAYATLHDCLVTLCRLIAPFMPFAPEAMHRNLTAPVPGAPESVHLADYPAPRPELIDAPLAGATRLAMTLSSLGRAARSRAGIRVRQPVAAALVGLRSADEREALGAVEAQVLDELNVRRIEVTEDLSGVSALSVRPNLPVLGRKYGAGVREIRAALASLDPFEVHAAVSAGRAVSAAGYELEPDEVLISAVDREGYSVAADGGYTVAIETALTPELIAEGTAREIVHGIQGLRRDAGFGIADRVVANYSAGPGLAAVIERHADHIAREILATDLIEGPAPAGAHSGTLTVGGEPVEIGLRLSAAGEGS